MKQDIILALDLGTSSVRAMLFDARGRALPDMEAQMPYAQRTTGDGGVEADPDVVFTRTVDAIVQILKRADPATRARIAAIGISCFWHSLMGVDDDGKPTTGLYSWADSRSKGEAAELADRLNPANYHARTGCVIHPSYWPAKLLWLSKTNEAAFSRTRRWMSFGEYLALRLFGEANVSLSMASGTGLLDQNAADWDDLVLKALPVDRKALSPIVDRDHAQTGLSKEAGRGLAPLRDIPWYPALGDGACSNAGSGAVSDRRIAINIGTSAAMRVMVEQEQVEIPDGLFCYRVDRKRFLVGGAFANGGNVYAWLQHTLQLGERPGSSRRIGTMTPDGHGLTVLPFWAGERSPGWHSDARADILGMNLHTTSLDIVRACLEAQSYRFAAVLDLVQKQYPHAREIVASGGGVVHDPAWMQILADVFQQPVTTSKISEASSRGAALLAAESVGLIKSIDEPSAYLGKSYRPDAGNAKVYADARERQTGMYEKLVEGA